MITCQSVFFNKNGGQKDISCVWWRMLDVTTFQIHLQHDTQKEKQTTRKQLKGWTSRSYRQKGNVKSFGQLITFKSTVHAELDHRMKCAWATAADRSWRHQKYTLRDRIKLFPQQRLHHFSTQSGTWTMTEELKKTLWTTHRPMMRRIIQTYRKTKNMSRNRTRSKRRRYRRRRTPRPRQRAGGRHDLAQPLTPQRARGKQPRHRQQPRHHQCVTMRRTRWRSGAVDRPQYASKPQDRRFVGSKRNHVVDPQTTQVIWATSKNGCQAPRRTPGNIHLQLETSDINQAERVSEAKKTSNEMGRRHQRILTTNQSLQRQQRSHERSDLARHGARWLEWDSMENRVCEQQTQTTNTSHDRHLHDNDNQTNSTRTHNAHDWSSRPRRGGVDDDDENDVDDTTHPLQHNRKWILNNDKATATNKPAQRQSVLQRQTPLLVNRASSSSADTSPLHSQRHDVSAGIFARIMSARKKVSGQTEKGSKPTHSGFFRASHCFVKLNEWSLSWSCILLNLGRVRFHLDFLSTTVSLVPKSISVEFISIQLLAFCCTDPYVVPIDPLRFQVVVVFLVTVSHKPSQPKNYRNGDAGDLGKLSATVSWRLRLAWPLMWRAMKGPTSRNPKAVHTYGSARGLQALLKRPVLNTWKSMTPWIMALVPVDADEATTETTSTWAIGRESRVSHGCGTCCPVHTWGCWLWTSCCMATFFRNAQSVARRPWTAMICTARGRSSYHEMLQAFDLFWSSKLLCFFQWQMSDHFLSRVRRW